MKNNLTALNETELNKVTGGVNLKGIRDTAIIATCATVGSLLGDLGSSTITTGINIKNNHCMVTKFCNTPLVLIDERGSKNLVVSHVVGLTVGAAAGAVVGKKIVDSLNKK